MSERTEGGDPICGQIGPFGHLKMREGEPRALMAFAQGGKNRPAPVREPIVHAHIGQHGVRAAVNVAHMVVQGNEG